MAESQLNTGEFGEFDHVHATLAGFNLRDKRLRAARCVGGLESAQL
jgi:hypothetical protein